ncbi:MAG: hypothetical protein ACI38Y_03080 [Candidatus Methanomethylophilaceae archaeon]
MDKKIIAVAVVAIIVVAAVGIYFVSQDNSDDEKDTYSIVARVNSEGSGVFLNAGENPSDYIEIVSQKPADGTPYLGEAPRYVVLHPEAWGGKVFGDPGVATIQHVQLGELAAAMGLNFEMYIAGSTLKNDTLYYNPGVGSYAAYATAVSTTPMTGEFIWEAQYSVAMENGLVGLVTTNDLFPDHTCCVIAGNNSFMEKNTDLTVRFLAAYVESVNKMSAALADPSSQAYADLVSVGMDKVAMPDGMTDAQKKNAIESALGIVTYLYADNNSSKPLTALEADISKLISDFQANGNLSADAVSKAGFSSADAAAAALVNGDYLAKALASDYQKADGTDKITVAVINGDIHQIAIHYGMTLGIFKDYGLEVTLSSQTGGPGVYGAMANGSAQFGFLGAPPMTTNAINNGAIATA